MTQDRPPLPPALESALIALRPRWARLEVPPGAAGVILGSGLGAAAARFPALWRRDFAELGLPAASVAGHRGSLSLVRTEGAPLLLLEGRLHRYEGLPDAQVLLPAAAMAALDLRAMLVTNAAGGLDPGLAPGDFMLIRDILSLQLADPLRGAREEAPRRPLARPLFDAALAATLRAAAADSGIALREGVLAAAPGPAYETRAELRLTRAMGAQAASMSTYPESVLLAHLGLPAAALSCITNLIREDAPALTHEEVLAVGRRSAEAFGRLLAAWARRLNA